MQFPLIRFSFIFLLVLSIFAGAQEPEFMPEFGSISKPAKQFIVWDSQHNRGAANHQNFDAFKRAIPYLEITLDPNKINLGRHYVDWFHGGDLGPHWFLLDQAEYLPESIRNFLITEENGIKKIKWLLSPQDSDFKYRLMEYFSDQNLEFQYFGTEEEIDQTQSQIMGFNTASRSVIAIIPSNLEGRIDEVFSFKTATSNHMQEESIDRPYPVNWSYFNRRLSDYYRSQRHNLNVVDIAWEALSLGVSPGEKNGDIALSVRTMESVSQGDKHHMSGFVLKDDHEMNRIAKLNGMTREQLKKKISFFFGQAMVEMNLVLGFRITSSHLQNMRVEFDENMQLTGRIIFLDLTDGSPVRAVMERNAQDELLDYWERFVSHTELASGKRPNEIIEKTDWKQVPFGNKHIDWFTPMDSEELTKGAKQRAIELGYTKGNIRIDSATKQIRFRFKSNEQLNGNFRSNSICRLHFLD